MPKIREGDQVQIGNSRIRLGGIDAPSVDQLCLNNKGERWTCGVAARDELIKHADNKSWTCHPRQTADRRGRMVARCEVDGEDIQKWMVRNGWALSYARVLPRLRRRREGRARGQGRHVAGRVHRAVGLARPQQEDHDPRRRQAAENAHAILLASASGPVAPSPDCTIKGNVNSSGECIYHKPTSRWYAQIKMKISKGTRWFCSVEEAEAAGCRETKR